MGGKSATADQEIARIATGAWGIVERRELLQAGVTGRMIERPVKPGSLIPEYRGVFRVGHSARSQESDYVAATKAGGASAFISGGAAAHALGLVKGKAPPPEETSTRRLELNGLRSTLCRKLHREDTTRWKGIPITSPARSLVDVAAHMSADALARACHEAGVRHGTTPAQVEARAETQAERQGRREAPRHPRRRADGAAEQARAWIPPEDRATPPAAPDHEQARRFTWSDVFEDPSYLKEEICGLLPTVPD